MADLRTSIGTIKLKNPVIAASCECTITESGIRACIDAGAGAVVVKSINERPEARRQLDSADYVLVSPQRTVTPWSEAGLDDSLFCRSGLVRTSLEEWLEVLSRCERYARDRDCVLVGSVTVAERDAAASIAHELSGVVRCIELNLSSPHGREAKSGAVSLLTDSEAVTAYTAATRAVVQCPLWIKLTGQTGDVVALAAAAMEAGADAVTMIGRFPGFLPDPVTHEPLLGSWGAIGGGWSLPISLYWISKTRLSLGADVPIIGTNGARCAYDVVRFLLSGARAVEIGSLLLTHGPGILGEVLGSLDAFLDQHGAEDLNALVGAALPMARTYGEIAASSRQWWWEASATGCERPEASPKTR